MGCGALTLHLVETVLLATRQDLVGSQTDARVGLQELLGHDARAARLGHLLILVVDGCILRLELLDQSVDVLVLFLLLETGLGREALVIAVLLLLVLRRMLEGASQ